MNRLGQMTFNYKRSIIFLLILSLITAFAVILQAYFLVAAVDQVFLNQQGISDIVWMLMGLLAVLLIRTMSSYANGRIGIKMAANVKAKYRKSLLRKYADTPIKQSAGGQSGGKVSVLLDTVDDMDSYFSEYIPQLIQTTVIPLVILIVAFTQHINTGLIMIITAPFIPIFMVIIGMQSKNKSEKQQEKLAAFSGRFLDTLQGLTTLKLFGRAKTQQEAIEKSSLSFRDATMEILKVAFTSSFMLELISMLSIGIVALELAIQLIIYERISFFTAFFLLVLVPEFYSMLKQLGSTFHNGRTSIGAATKVTESLNEEIQPVQWGDQVLPVDSMPGVIQLNNANFNYDEGQFSLKQITATIAPYQQVAIVGRSGSGKTTLLHLIAGLLPTESGEITVNELPLTHYSEHDWFGQLSYISQQPYIFSGTIAENIAIGANSNASRQAIEKAAGLAGIAELIQTLDEGYDTPIGEAGRGLSGGEMQRLALARAFLKKPALILFDEPTTGLDLYTEKILQQSIKQLAEKATVITVAHRLHTIKHADNILFLEDGKLMAEGTHGELFEHVPEYRQMVSVQRGGKAE
ncbi:thiol reductant ABC exporter subunit CydD [Lentibacillus sp. CBA3610]|uniref:thiol reductant ABC exporter subunit CydD n=1 Tax=Lentibacillus sp. CBA3610 TaxID=2518176 RepID=UPI001595CA96|nr:thiol reductant ABC exporter subunit CydD [Lentibacillus sp. CBA3610]QKY68908.1 thiol reductant ABC exporter subunit CydD [Lentibacillus sp. CBA3610]